MIRNNMKEINKNKSGIIGLALDGKLKVDEIIFSIVNNCKYKIVKCSNHQGEWIGVQEVI